MKPWSLTRLHPPAAWLVGFALVGTPVCLEAAELLHDFDCDGVPEKLVSTPQVNEIYQQDATGAWVKEDYALPEGVWLVDEAGRDAGLRFLDLNGDGFDDILFANDARYAIYLWTKNVQPQLGWTRGWSQFVSAGERKGEGLEPPSLVDTTVTLEDGWVIVRRKMEDGVLVEAARVSAKQLIAFDMPPPKTPEEALASFRVREGFRVELVAAEPLVVDPIAFDWDAQGRLWVVEMRDYPLGLNGRGQPGGVIKVLEDSDGDGRYDRATPFLEGVAFPTGVLPWKRGVLISAAPDLLYAEDTDGDGRADVKQVLFTGFHQGNQQHLFNGFAWGLDGWVYASNGDSGGHVKSLATGRELSISGRDIRFRPETGEVETVSGQSQFGRQRDDWGHWFGNNNSTWIWHVTMPEHYLRRNPRLAVTAVHTVTSRYENWTRVFPASPPMVRPNQPWSLNHVTSACGPAPYRDDWFGPEFAASVFISEPVHNLIHREVLEPYGASFSSRRAPGEEEREFLASTDPWFRPTSLKTGPEGALYVADMYRFVVEHPEWISPEQQARLDLRAGDDKGRIYRIVPEHRPRRPIPRLDDLTVPELASALDSSNGWQRDMAMRLLLERNDPAAVEPLKQLLTLTHMPQVRLQALATLGLLGQLGRNELLAALADPHPAVRAEALRQSEALARDDDDALWAAVAVLAQDSEASVRLQAAFSLGAWPPARHEPVLRELARRPDTDEWIRQALLSSLRPESELFAELQQADAQARPAAAAVVELPASSEDRAAVLARYAGLDKLTGDPQRGREYFQTLCALCHRLRGEGYDIGPDLGMTSNKPTEWLLAAILDPNQVVEARYRAWSLTLASGETLTGLIAVETANNLVLKLPGGAERAVLRRDIAALEPLPLSLMPQGFESALPPQAMADLLQWLRAKP